MIVKLSSNRVAGDITMLSFVCDAQKLLAPCDGCTHTLLVHTVRGVFEFVVDAHTLAGLCAHLGAKINCRHLRVEPLAVDGTIETIRQLINDHSE